MVQQSDQRAGSVVVVTPPPVLDRAAAQVLRAALAQARSRPCSLLLVEMAGVSFVDSTCLGVLVGAIRSLEPGQRLHLCNTSDRVRRVLRQTRFETFVELHAEGEPWPWPDLPRIPSPRT